MPVMMVLMFLFHGLAQDLRVELAHEGAVRADGADIPALFPAVGTGEDIGGEERGGGGGAHEDGIGLVDMAAEMLVIFLVLGAQDGELEFRVGRLGADAGPFVLGVEVVHQLLGPLEGPVDDVDMVDFGPAQQQREPDVPPGLQAGAEDGDGVDALADVEELGGEEGGAEGG